MAQVRMENTVSLSEATELVATCGKHATFMFRGGMGIGKSSILYTLAERFADTHDAVYVDMTTRHVGDSSGVPMIEERVGRGGKKFKVTHFAPNSELRLYSDRPVIMMLDEYGKAARQVQNTYLRLMLERRMGEDAMHSDSFLFGTLNKTGEGLGDMMLPHARNRVSVVDVVGEDADGWCNWAIGNGVEPEVIAWVHQTPHCLASFDEPGQENNEHIYHPNKPATAFVTQRSLTKASHVIKHRAVLGANATIAGVAGYVGEPAARALMAYAALADKLPTWESIIKDPATAKLPAGEDAAASFITVYSAITRVEKETMKAWMTYCQRMDKTFQAIFALGVLVSPKRAAAVMDKSFSKWAVDNHWMID